jgi:hypothetical protein
MGTEGRSADRKRAVAAALRRFPQHELTIHRLIDRAESFRDMCEELADAEMALARVNEAPLAQREERRAEWQALVDRLVGEVETELRACDPSKLRPNPSPKQ